MCLRIDAKGVTPIPPPMSTATSDPNTSSAGAGQAVRENYESAQLFWIERKMVTALTSEGTVDPEGGHDLPDRAGRDLHRLSNPGVALLGRVVGTDC